MVNLTVLSDDDQITMKEFFYFIAFVPPDKHFGKRYGVSVAITLLAFGLRDLPGGTLIYSFPFGLFIPATLLATWYGGFGAGVAALMGSSILGVFFFLEPYNEWGPLTTYGSWALCLHLVTSSIGICLITLERAYSWKFSQEIAHLRMQIIHALTSHVPRKEE